MENFIWNDNNDRMLKRFKLEKLKYDVLCHKKEILKIPRYSKICDSKWLHKM